MQNCKERKKKVDGEVIDGDVTLIFPAQHGGDIVFVSLSDFFKASSLIRKGAVIKTGQACLQL